MKKSRQKLKYVEIDGETISTKNYKTYWKKEFKSDFEFKISINSTTRKAIISYCLTAFMRNRLLRVIKNSKWIFVIDKAGKSKTKPIDIGVFCKKPNGLHWKITKKQFLDKCANKSNPCITISDFGEGLGRIHSKHYMKSAFQILKFMVESMVHTKNQKCNNLEDFQRNRAEFSYIQRKLDLKLKDYKAKVLKMYNRSKK